MTNATLFLDYDGVLHADPVFLDSRSRKPVLAPEFGPLFQWTPPLERILTKFYPTVEIVLSTSWASVLGFEEARSYLPPALAERVVDCVWKKNEWPVHRLTKRQLGQMSGCEQILQYVNRKQLTRWVALDNDDEQWPDSQRFRLVKTEDMTGFSTDEAHADLCRIFSVIAEPMAPAGPA